MFTPAEYDAWYHTSRGQWVGNLEFGLLQKLLQAKAGGTLLDVGCGTGYFTRRFRESGLQVTGIDPDPLMLEYARQQSRDIDYQQGRAEDLPFADNSFDYVAAITSLCFVQSPEQAVEEMWRVANKAVILGLLNRHSLLYRQKQGKGAYQDARWDTCCTARQWSLKLAPQVQQSICQSGFFIPSGSRWARVVEKYMLPHLPVGGFLAIYLEKP